MFILKLDHFKINMKPVDIIRLRPYFKLDLKEKEPPSENPVLVVIT